MCRFRSRDTRSLPLSSVLSSCSSHAQSRDARRSLTARSDYMVHVLWRAGGTVTKAGRSRRTSWTASSSLGRWNYRLSFDARSSRRAASRRRLLSRRRRRRAFAGVCCATVEHFLSLELLHCFSCVVSRAHVLAVGRRFAPFFAVSRFFVVRHGVFFVILFASHLLSSFLFIIVLIVFGAVF